MAETNSGLQLPLIRLSRWPASWSYALVLLIWLVYLGLSLYAPISLAAKTLHINLTVLAWVKITVALFYLFVWLGGTFSMMRLEGYTHSLTEGTDRQAFHHVKTGLFVLVVGSVIATFLSSIQPYLPTHAFIPYFVIVANYLNVFPNLVAFIYFYIGIKVLTSEQPSGLKLRSYIVYIIPLFLLAYTWLEIIFSNPSRTVAIPPMTTATYYLPDSLLILTIVLPSILAWVLGILAAMRLYRFHQMVRGTLYRQALSSLVIGFSSVVVASILFGALQALGAHRLLDFGLERLLVMIYIFILIQGVGYFMIARGAQRLHKIEMV